MMRITVDDETHERWLREEIASCEQHAEWVTNKAKAEVEVTLAERDEWFERLAEYYMEEE